ncbi:MAG: SoxR reducing system RseC family protein [Candidatus Omnitrophota bacterium]
MKEHGKVVKVNNNIAEIEVKPHEECHKCGVCGAARPRRITVSGENVPGLAAGDNVEVEIEPSAMLKLYSLLYGAPLVAFVGASLLLYAVLRSPLVSFAGALAATIFTYIAAGRLTRKIRIFSPHITKK